MDPQPPAIPRDSTEASYEVLLTVRHADLGQFLIRYYVKTRAWVVGSHIAIILFMASVWIRLGADLGLSFGSVASGVGWAAIAFLFLIPLHEAVHGAVYWILGAQDIRYGISIRRMRAFAIAHRHVVSARELIWVNIAPFLFVTSLLTGCMALLPEASFVVVGTVVLHTLGCAGDWAMLNFVWSNRERELYTYDDAGERTRTFIATRSPRPTA